MFQVSQRITLALALASAILLSARTAPAAPADRFLHVQVVQSRDGENVNVNLPLSVAEKVLPTIDRGPLHQGRVTVPNDKLQGVDVKAIVDAIRTGPDSRIVTVKQNGNDIVVEKANGNIVIHVKDSSEKRANKGETVDVTVPITVVDALFSGARQDELDLAAALNALDRAGDTFLVTVENASEHVRVWVDNKNQPE